MEHYDMEMRISVEDSLLFSGSYSYPAGMKQIGLLNSEDRIGLDKSRGWTDEERQANPRRKNIWQSPSMKAK
jgi:hypothetical protein